jgi:hypothetical protein
MAFTITWDNTRPVGASETVASLDTFLQQLQVAIAERINSIGGSTADWNTATDPLKWSKLNLSESAVAKILAGATSLAIRDSGDAVDLLLVTDDGDVTVLRDFTVTRDAYLASMKGNVRHSTGQATTHIYDAGNKTGASTLDLNNGAQQKMTLTGNVSSLTISNPVAGGQYVFYIKQDGTGGRTVSWPATFKWGFGGSAPTLTTTASRTDIIGAIYDGTNYAAVVISQNHAL